MMSQINSSCQSKDLSHVPRVIRPFIHENTWLKPRVYLFYVVVASAHVAGWMTQRLKVAEAAAADVTNSGWWWWCCSAADADDDAGQSGVVKALPPLSGFLRSIKVYNAIKNSISIHLCAREIPYPVDSFICYLHVYCSMSCHAIASHRRPHMGRYPFPQG